nr:MAG TPA: hypothetical protein [Crassvirales sp.]
MIKQPQPQHQLHNLVLFLFSFFPAIWRNSLLSAKLGNN